MANKRKEEVDYDTLLADLEREMKVHNLANAVYHQSSRYHRIKFGHKKNLLNEFNKETTVDADDEFAEFKRRMTKGTEEHARDLDLEAMNNTKIVEKLRTVRSKILDQKLLRQQMLQKRDNYETELKAIVIELNAIYLNNINLILDKFQITCESDWRTYDDGSRDPMAALFNVIPIERRGREHVPVFPKMLRIQYQNYSVGAVDEPILEHEFDIMGLMPESPSYTRSSEAGEQE